MSAQGVTPGVLQVHSAPPALCPHIEWAVAGVLGVPVDLPWTAQPASPGSLRAELTWEGRAGSAGAITSALAGWNLSDPLGGRMRLAHGTLAAWTAPRVVGGSLRVRHLGDSALFA